VLPCRDYHRGIPIIDRYRGDIMTAALPDWDIAGPTDAELARAAAAGDRGAFAGIYDRYADRLHDFCIGMVRDRDAAADCVQDVFCTAATNLSQLREPDKLRPWLYAIARNQALRYIRSRRREEASDELPDAASGDPSPETLAARGELADLIAEAAGGLSDRDRLVLELAYRHGLDGPELAEALGVSRVGARSVVQRLRETIERSLGALLVARGAQRNPNRCPDLAAILAGWDGKFSVLMRKRIARHIESCAICDQERRRLVNPVALLGTVPVFIPAPGWLRDETLNQIHLLAGDATTSASKTADPDAGSSQPRLGAAPVDQVPQVPVNGVDETHSRRVRHLMVLGALFVATLIASLGLAIAWQQQHSTRMAPADVSGTAPKPINRTSGAPTTAGAIPNNPPPAPPAPATGPTSSPVAIPQSPPTPPSAGPTSSPVAPLSPGGPPPPGAGRPTKPVSTPQPPVGPPPPGAGLPTGPTATPQPPVGPSPPGAGTPTKPFTPHPIPVRPVAPSGPAAPPGGAGGGNPVY
jgi:RNA polymerase sigma factor (sigma-70 family)